MEKLHIWATHQTKTQVSKVDALKETIRAWGLNPEEVLTRDSLSQPHRTAIDPSRPVEAQITQLTTVLNQQTIKEIHENQPGKSIKSCSSNGNPERFELSPDMYGMFLLVNWC